MPAASTYGLTLNRFAATLVIATAIVLAALCVGISVGSTGRFGWPAGSWTDGVLSSRIERVTLAAMVGLALGGAGAMYQAVLRNELADPYLLGIASGAALSAYAWRLPAIAAMLAALHPALATLSQQAFTFAGAVAAATLVLALAGVRGRIEPSKIVLVGVIVSTICGALMLLLFTLVRSVPGSGTMQTVFIGELQTSLSDGQRWTAAGVIVVGLLAMMVRSPRLNVLLLGDDEARALGLGASHERLISLLLASLVTAAAVSVSGPIGFVGLIAPHAARRLVGADVRLQLPAAAAGGAVLLVLADALLRYLAGTHAVNTIIPVGVATALLGGPFFLSLLLRRRTEGE